MFERSLEKSPLPQALLLLCTLYLTGCNRASESPFEGRLEPATGVVTIDGAPRAGVQVTFMPMQGTPGTGGFAVTDETGYFIAKHRSGREGVEAGNYELLFSFMTKADGTPLGPDDDMATMGTEQLPQYQSPGSPAIPKAKFPSYGTELKFDLKSGN